jgi:hypothetical protein
MTRFDAQYVLCKSWLHGNIVATANTVPILIFRPSGPADTTVKTASGPAAVGSIWRTSIDQYNGLRDGLLLWCALLPLGP